MHICNAMQCSVYISAMTMRGGKARAIIYNELISDSYEHFDVHVNTLIDAWLQMNPFHLCMILHTEKCNNCAISDFHQGQINTEIIL